MAYLSYEEYLNMGGTLDSTAFNTAERKAVYTINAQAGGRTGERISKLENIPTAIKDCVYELISYQSKFPVNDKQIASESISQGGRSESLSYAVKTSSEITEETEKIIYDNLVGGGFGWLLYRGACI